MAPRGLGTCENTLNGLVDLPQKSLKLFYSKKRWPPKHNIDHNSTNFHARSSRFCLVVNIDHHQKYLFIKPPKKMAAKNGCQNTKLITTHSKTSKSSKINMKATSFFQLFAACEQILFLFKYKLHTQGDGWSSPLFEH